MVHGMTTQDSLAPLDIAAANASHARLADALIRLEPLTWDGDEAPSRAEVEAAKAALEAAYRQLAVFLPQRDAALAGGAVSGARATQAARHRDSVPPE
ncbi:MAG: hypothetical protein Tsb0020_18550 [Haliangiales bacterium]